MPVLFVSMIWVGGNASTGSASGRLYFMLADTPRGVFKVEVMVERILMCIDCWDIMTRRCFDFHAHSAYALK